MNNQAREELYKFIDSVPVHLWTNWLGICGSVLDFYSSEKSEFDADNDLFFFVDLLKNEQNSIAVFRDKFRIYIENHRGEFKKLSSFPKYFQSRNEKIRNPEADKIRIELFTERDISKRKNLINKLSNIEEPLNPEYKPLTKIEEAEHCLYWATRYCRTCFNDRSELEEWLPRATFLYGYACGLLEMNSEIMLYYKLNKDKSPQEKGGQVLKNKAEFAKSQVITLWRDRFNNSELIKKNKAEFGRYIYNNPHLITDAQGNTLKKPNGDNWYTDPNTVSALLPKN